MKAVILARSFFRFHPFLHVKTGSSFPGILLLFSFILLLNGCGVEEQHADRNILFSKDWKFHKGDPMQAMLVDYDDAAWREVDLPHDWAIEGAFSPENSSGTGYLPGGIGWYRKNFALPPEVSGETVYLVFDGAYQQAEVWVNGTSVGKRPYGYISFYFDITAYLQPGGNNVIAVRLDHTNVADSRWYTGNGIYRNVWLIRTGKVHVKPWGTYVTTPDISPDQATASIEVELLNHLTTPVRVAMVNEVIGPGGTIVGRSEQEVEVQPSAPEAGSDARTNPRSDVGTDAGKERTEQLTNPGDGQGQVADGKGNPAAGKEGTTPGQFSSAEGTAQLVSGKVRIPAPSLWSPESPAMYKVVTTLTMDGEVMDRYTTDFGIRSIAFDPDKGFSCNGKPYKLKGICLHHDFGPLGAARHPNSAYMVLKKLKEAGANAIRTSHNPEDPGFLTMLDTMGFFVQGEAFDEWRHGKKKWIQGWNVGREEGKEGLDIYYGTGGYSDFFDEWAEQDIKDMVRRDRNHPSIVMWSIGNEIDYPNDPYADPADPFWEPGKPEPPELMEIAGNLVKWVKELDTTRFVTAALANIPLANRVGYAELLDVVGYNYQEEYYSEDHETFPERVMYGSENGDSREAWEAVRDNDFISAQFLWTGIDYHGEAGRFPRHSAGAGIMDMCGFEKPLYYQRKSWWTDEPMIKSIVFPAERGGRMGFRWPAMHWNFASAAGNQGTGANTPAAGNQSSGNQSSGDQKAVEGQEEVRGGNGPELIVGAYTNCDVAELFLNGESLGKRDQAASDFRERFWRVVYVPGELKMIGYRDGQQVCEDLLITAGEIAALELQSYEPSLHADGSDIAHVTVQAVDADGVPVPDADLLISFEVNGGGTLRAVGNGDLSSLEPYQGNTRKLYNGKALVIVQSDGSSEDIVLSAAHGDISQSLIIPLAE